GEVRQGQRLRRRHRRFQSADSRAVVQSGNAHHQAASGGVQRAKRNRRSGAQEYRNDSAGPPSSCTDTKETVIVPKNFFAAASWAAVLFCVRRTSIRTRGVKFRSNGGMKNYVPRNAARIRAAQPQTQTLAHGGRCLTGSNRLRRAHCSTSSL